MKDSEEPADNLYSDSTDTEIDEPPPTALSKINRLNMEMKSRINEMRYAVRELGNNDVAQAELMVLEVENQCNRLKKYIRRKKARVENGRVQKPFNRSNFNFSSVATNTIPEEVCYDQTEGFRCVPEEATEELLHNINDPIQQHPQLNGSLITSVGSTKLLSEQGEVLSTNDSGDSNIILSSISDDFNTAASEVVFSEVTSGDKDEPMEIAEMFNWIHKPLAIEYPNADIATNNNVDDFMGIEDTTNLLTGDLEVGDDGKLLDDALHEVNLTEEHLSEHDHAFSDSTSSESFLENPPVESVSIENEDLIKDKEKPLEPLCPMSLFGPSPQPFKSLFGQSNNSFHSIFGTSSNQVQNQSPVKQPEPTQPVFTDDVHSMLNFFINPKVEKIDFEVPKEEEKKEDFGNDEDMDDQPDQTISDYVHNDHDYGSREEGECQKPMEDFPQPDVPKKDDLSDKPLVIEYPNANIATNNNVDDFIGVEDPTSLLTPDLDVGGVGEILDDALHEVNQTEEHLSEREPAFSDSTSSETTILENPPVESAHVENEAMIKGKEKPLDPLCPASLFGAPPQPKPSSSKWDDDTLSESSFHSGVHERLSGTCMENFLKNVHKMRPLEPDEYDLSDFEETDKEADCQQNEVVGADEMENIGSDLNDLVIGTQNDAINDNEVDNGNVETDADESVQFEHNDQFIDDDSLLRGGERQQVEKPLPQLSSFFDEEAGTSNERRNNVICLSSDEENDELVRKRKILDDNNSKVKKAKKQKIQLEAVSNEEQELRNRKRLAARDGKVTGVEFVEDIYEAEAKGLPVVKSMCLDEYEGFRLEVPLEIRNKLRYHQAEALVFMYLMLINKIGDQKHQGVILGHCMGLGKTMVCISFLHLLSMHKLLRKHVMSVLILAPLSVIHNWKEELIKWLPKGQDIFGVDMIESGTPKKLRSQKILMWAKKDRPRILIMGHSMFKTLQSEYSHILGGSGPTFLICDEAHVAKNQSTQIFSSLCQIKTGLKVAVTGTPMQNNFKELFSLVELVRSGGLGCPKVFKNLFEDPIQLGCNVDASTEAKKLRFERICVLKKLVKGILHYRGLEFLEDQIPPIHEFAVYCRLTAVQIAYYNEFLKHILEDIHRGVSWKEMGKQKVLMSNYHEMYRCWTHLKLLEVRSEDMDKKATVTTGWHKAASKRIPYKFSDNPHPQDSMKIVFVLELLKEAEKYGDKTIIFCRSQDLMNLFAEILKRLARSWAADGHLDRVPNSKNFEWKEGSDFARICGSDKGAAFRTQIQNEFNNPNNHRLRLLLVSTQSGSSGMNLIGGNRVVLFDIDWNPANDRQALHRAYRIGQQKEVFVYRLIAEGTMEEAMYKVQFNKDMNNATFFKDADVKKQYTAEECQQFYSLTSTAYDKTNPTVFRDYSEDDPALQRIISKHNGLAIKITEPSLMLKTQEDGSYLSPQAMDEAFQKFDKEKNLLEPHKYKPADVEAAAEVFGQGISDLEFLNFMKSKVGNVKKTSYTDPYYAFLAGQIKPMFKAAIVYVLWRETDKIYKAMDAEQREKYFNTMPDDIIKDVMKDSSIATKGDKVAIRLRKFLRTVYEDLKDKQNVHFVLGELAREIHGIK